MADVGQVLPGLGDLWRETSGDPEICVAILDGRVDLSHSCFNGAQLSEVAPIWLQHILGRYGSIHGTHVSSVVFGRHGGPVSGIAPRCRGIVIPVYGEDEQGELIPCSQIDLARAIALARGEGAHIINVSGGQNTPTGEADPFLADAVRKCASQDILVVAATGNEGGEYLHVPAALPSVLAVGAADANGEPMGFSNWGEPMAQSGILAPGENIRGAVPGGGVQFRTGTSFATPIVTGVAALLLSLQKQRGQKPSPQAVRDALIASAMPCLPNDDPEDCERMLAGRLNIPGAYARLFGTDGAAADSVVPQDTCPAYVIRSPPPRSAEQGVVCHGHFEAPEEERSMSNQHDVVATSYSDLSNQIAQLQALMTQLQALAPQQPPASDRGAPGTPPALGIASEASTAGPAGDVQASSIPADASLAPAFRAAPASLAAVPGVAPAKGGSAGCMCGAGGLVRPSQVDQPAPPALPENEFITYQNSQLVFAIGDIGYDFGTEARRDYFVQQFQGVFQDDRLREAAGVLPGNIPTPENYKAMAVYLNAAQVIQSLGQVPT